jgi:multidrug efflux pump subunit AcrA (membrane-fusion protein)
VMSKGAVETRPVEVLRRGRDQIAIASGLREGERVALREPDTAGGSK